MVGRKIRKQTSMGWWSLGLYLAALAGIMIGGFNAPSVQAQTESRLAATVNDEPITVLDLQNRAKLALLSAGLPPDPAILQRMTRQVLDTLIDEVLQRQEAEAQNIKVKEREITEALANMERANELPPGGLDNMLKARGLARATIEIQTESALAWQKLVQRRLRPQIEIGDDEIDDELRKVEENRGKSMQLVSEIFLAVDDQSKEPQVRQAAERILQQLAAGASFGALARAFSQKATSASGGDLGWIVPGHLPEELDRALAQMQPGQVSIPLRTRDGYHILALRERRLPGGGSAHKVTLDLRQIVIPLSPTASPEELEAMRGTIGEIRALATDCPALESAALPGNAVVKTIGRVVVGELAPQFRQPLISLDSNQISVPLRDRSGGIILFMVCDRQAPEEALPDRDAVRDRLLRDKLDLLARRYLRDLRRAANLDIRI